MAPRGGSGRGWAPRGGAYGGRRGRGRDARNEGERGGAHGGRGSNIVCRNFKEVGSCRFGVTCKYSHDLTNAEHSRPLREQTEPTAEQQQAKVDYNAWKRYIKVLPRANDLYTMKLVWSGALEILDAEDRDWKQMLPRDLDDDEFHGREHIHTLLSMVSHSHGCTEFVNLARSFLSVITHPALLDCLSIDTFMGNLYNYISGSNGNRSISFFERLATNLLEAHNATSVSGLNDSLEMTLIDMTAALCEVLRRERRATFHDDLPNLINLIEIVGDTIILDKTSVSYSITSRRIAELRAIFSRANGLLEINEEPHLTGVSTTTITSTYPREIVVPGNRHDNDQMDITRIKILPTYDEIRSSHAEFLPSTDPDQPHFLTNLAERHLDTQFRLLRHDIFGELKQALDGMMTAVENDPTLLTNPKLNVGDIRAYPFPGAHIRYISYDQRRGLETQISFPQHPLLKKKSASERRTWWEDSKRLEEGALLCFVSLIDAQSSILFFTVSEKCTDINKDFSLSADSRQSIITAKLATWNQNDMELLIRMSCQNTRGALIEFPDVLLATFVPILENLQNMQRQSRLPFRQWILPDPIGTHGNRSTLLAIPPPLYARVPNFTFSLQKILKNPLDDFSLSPNTPIENAVTIDELEARTSLDRGQCKALVAALFREFAFVVGPPGTGKSFLGGHLMRILLASKAKAKLGPIIIVCYTNHALDQFLEQLVEIGIDKIIRIGGQSKSAVLEGKNLRIVSQTEGKTKSEGYLLATTYKELEGTENSITKQLKYLHSGKNNPGWMNFKNHLAKKYPYIYNQFARMADDGFEIVGRDPFDVWISEKSPIESNGSEKVHPFMSIEMLLRRAMQGVNRLSLPDRHRLVEYWMTEIREAGTDLVYELTKSAKNLRKQLSNIHDDVDRRVLQTADVIGVTTTGLARRIATLNHVRCKVVICEEAGEVMEPHILSAFLPSVEHFIQIGDHHQLRAQINNHALSVESKRGLPYQLDRSQFERLSVGERGRPVVPIAQLDIQRRMRPEISTLIRETIYPHLLDHETTKCLPDVVGMRKNVFWLNHDELEVGAIADVHQKSHSNPWEVEMTHALVRHIVRQGVYNGSDIAVLTPYTGQLQKLRAKMRNDFEVVLSERDEETLTRDGFNDEESDLKSPEISSQSDSRKRPLQKKKLIELLRISSIDGFQGAEAKIIIISLVRSNKAKKVGFLKTTNRINVLLSRAQHGMYLIGNADTYSNIPMWSKVIGMLQATDAVDGALGLCCTRHPDTEIQVSQPDDFLKLSPEGGCQLTCDRRLSECGHRCLAKCHSESMHQVFSCPQPCQRRHSPCNHACQKATCGEDCGVCMTKVNNVGLPCGHSKDNVLCYQTQDIDTIKCIVLVAKRVPACGHVVETQCWRDMSAEGFICPTSCQSDLTCGHRCPGHCGRCRKTDADNQPLFKHIACKKVCGRRLPTCNHTCPRFCHVGNDCGPCLLPCEVRCAHSRCTQLCREACAPCVEACAWSCEHKGTCSMPCAAPCARLPCNQRCSKSLSCGHQCPSVCGEVCPENYCHSCGDKGEARVDLLEMKTYKEIDLAETPIIALGCGHFFTAESLDGLVGMGEVYAIDVQGDFTGLRDVSIKLAHSIPRCPDCQGPIRQHSTRRYNRVVNRAVIDEMSKRFLVDGQHELRDLEKKVEELEEKLETTRTKFVDSIKQEQSGLATALAIVNGLAISKELKDRQAESTRLWKEIRSFCSKVADKHQPAQKLHDATIHAARERSISEGMENIAFVDTVPVVPRDRRVTLGGQIAQIRADQIVLTYQFALAQDKRSSSSSSSINVPGGNPHQLAIPFFQTCEVFINKCTSENLPKLGVEAIIYYAKVARSCKSSCASNLADAMKATKRLNFAKTLLEKAKEMCTQPFHNAGTLGTAVEKMMMLLGKEHYEVVTPEELAAIKAAMVNGPSGIATHSGHWYNCANGHPFAIGECGMPMERARCPECGASVGGQNHQAVDGVTRATNMEA